MVKIIDAILLVASANAIQYRPYPGTAPWYKEATESTWITPDWEVDYKVPNFGPDTDIAAT